MNLYAIAASILFAQSPTSGLVTFLPLVVIMVIFYVLLIFPHNAVNQKTYRPYCPALKTGDKVVATSGGIYHAEP